MLAIACGSTVTTWDTSKFRNGHDREVTNPKVQLYHSTIQDTDHSSSNIETLLPHSSSGILSDLAWSHNGQFLATCCQLEDDDEKSTFDVVLTHSHKRTRLDAFRNNTATTTGFPERGPTSIGFGGKLAKSRYLCVSDYDGSVSVWDLKKSSRVRQFRVDKLIASKQESTTTFQKAICVRAAIDPTDTWVAALSGITPNLFLFRLKEGDLARTLQLDDPDDIRDTTKINDNNHLNTMNRCCADCFQFSNLYLHHIAVGKRNGSVLLWDVSSMSSSENNYKVDKMMHVHSKSVTEVAFSPLHRTLLASVSLDNTIAFHDIYSKKKIQVVDTSYRNERSTGGITSFAFHPNGLLCATGTENGKVNLYDLRNITSGPVASLDVSSSSHQHAVRKVQFTPECKQEEAEEIRLSATEKDHQNTQAGKGSPLGHENGAKVSRADFINSKSIQTNNDKMSCDDEYSRLASSSRTNDPSNHMNKKGDDDCSKSVDEQMDNMSVFSLKSTAASVVRVSVPSFKSKIDTLQKENTLPYYNRGEAKHGNDAYLLSGDSSAQLHTMTASSVSLPQVASSLQHTSVPVLHYSDDTPNDSSLQSITMTTSSLSVPQATSSLQHTSVPVLNNSDDTPKDSSALSNTITTSSLWLPQATSSLQHTSVPVLNHSDDTPKECKSLSRDTTTESKLRMMSLSPASIPEPFSSEEQSRELNNALSDLRQTARLLVQEEISNHDVPIFERVIHSSPDERHIATATDSNHTNDFIETSNLAHSISRSISAVETDIAKKINKTVARTRMEERDRSITIAMDTLRDDVEESIRNLHSEFLRLMFIQGKQLSSMINELKTTVSALKEENDQLREENMKLRRLF